MKLSTKIILPIILISALLILLTGCFGVPTDESPGFTPGTITGVIASPCCSTSADPVSETCCIAPEYWCFYCQQAWSLQDGIEVVLTYGEDEVATTTTNENGGFTFTNVPPGKNYVITAYCPDFDDNRPLVKDVALELIEGGSFDTKITDLVSTSLGLVVDFLVLYTEWGPEDISLDEVLADRTNFPNFPKFKKLVYEVRKVVENCEVNLLTDDDVLYATCRAAEEISGLNIGCGPGYTPPPPEPDPCDPNTAPIINKVEYSDDGVNFTEIIEGTTIHVIKGKSYTVKADVSDDGIKDPLTFQAFLDGTGLGTYPYPGINVGLGIPLGDWDLGTHEIKVEFYDGCTTKTWGPVTVVVHPITYTLTTAVDPAGSGSVTGGGTYNSGETATVTAIPASGWEFTGWSGALTGDTNPDDILMDADKSVTAHFARITYTLTTAVDPAGSGSVTGGGTYNSGETATVTAIPASGWEFTGWSGALTGDTNPDDILMDADKSVTAHFARITYTLTTAVDPAGSGSVTGGGTYNSGETATVTAIPASGWEFTGWSGALTGDTNPDDILMDADKSVTAHFARITYTLTTAVDPAGSGSVTGGGTYNSGETATVTAIPASGWEFTGWSGALTGDTNPDDILMDADKSVTAHFARITYTLTTAVDPAGSGSVTGGGTYNSGETATVTAIPASGWEFTGWSGALTGDTNPDDILMDADKSVTAHFARITYTLTTAVDPAGSGSVTGGGTYNSGETATVTAIPASGWEFTGWSGALTGDTNPDDILMDADKSVTAHFARITYTLTTAVDPAGSGSVTGGGTYNSGETATVTAIPASGWEFTGWSGALTGDTNPDDILMDADKSVTAHFARITYTLTTAVDPAGSGSVTGGGTYNSGETATVTAIPASGWEFTGWSGALTGDTNPDDILMDADKSVTAHFARITYTLTTAVDPAGSGSVTGGGTYNSGETATVTAIPASGWEFTGWSGALTGDTNPDDILMDADKSVTAHFAQVNVINYLLVRGYHAKSGCTGLQVTHEETPEVPHYIEPGLWLYAQDHTPNVKNINFIARYDGVSTTIEYRYRYRIQYRNNTSPEPWVAWTNWSSSGTSLGEDTYGYGFESDCMRAPSDTSNPAYYCYQFELEIMVNGNTNTYLVHVD